MSKSGKPHDKGHHGDRKAWDVNRDAKKATGPLSAAEAEIEAARLRELDKKLDHPGWEALEQERRQQGNQDRTP